MSSPSINPAAFHPRHSPASLPPWRMIEAAHRAAPPRVIAFHGPAGVGKSTAAKLLADEWPGCQRLSFADPLRAMLCGLGLSDADLSAGKRLPHSLLCDRTPRHAMQTLGTEWGRKLIGADVWINAASRRISALLATGHRVAIDDCRFENEAELVHSCGGLVIRLVQEGVVSGLTPAEALHASERPMPASQIDHVLAASSVPDMQRQLRAMLADISPA